MKKSFTLIDLLIIVVIIGILGTFALPAYQNILEKAKEKTCITNLDVLLGALESYGLENDRLPGTLGLLENKHLEKAWAKVLENKNVGKIKLAYFISDLDKQGLAYAQEAWVQRYVGDLKYFSCPADDTPASAGGISYGLNSNLEVLSSFEVENEERFYFN